MNDDSNFWDAFEAQAEELRGDWRASLHVDDAVAVVERAVELRGETDRGDIAIAVRRLAWASGVKPTREAAFELASAALAFALGLPPRMDSGHVGSRTA